MERVEKIEISADELVQIIVALDFTRDNAMNGAAKNACDLLARQLKNRSVGLCDCGQEATTRFEDKIRCDSCFAATWKDAEE